MEFSLVIDADTEVVFFLVSLDDDLFIYILLCAWSQFWCSWSYLAPHNTTFKA